MAKLLAYFAFMVSDNMPRPLSPHLHIYRWQLTSVMSILHRMTGISLVIGSLLLVYWLCSAALGEAADQTAQGFLASWIGLIALMGWSFAFYFHFANGVRHLFWDMGRGYSLHSTYRSGWLAIAAAFILTIMTWVAVFL